MEDCIKYIALTEEELADLIKQAGAAGAKRGIEAYERRLEKEREEANSRVRNSAKAILIHYRQLKKMEDTSVTDVDTVTDATLKDILEGILTDVRRNDFELTSTSRNRIVTGMLMNHVDVQLENYKEQCRRSRIQEIQRRYRVVEMMYLVDEPLPIDEIAEAEMIDKSTVYRTLERAYGDLSVLFFGVEGLSSGGRKYAKSKK